MAARVSSQAIGSEHERQVADLLRGWHIVFGRKRKFRTNHGSDVELDFWLPASGDRPPVVIECKTFGVAARSTADSRRRKAQEALYLLVQVHRHCLGTEGSRIIVVTGKEKFLSEQLKLLNAELGPDFHVVGIDDPESLRRLLVV